MKPAIILHGGSGIWKTKSISKAKNILQKAADVGIKILKDNGSSLDAVETTVNFLENSGFFNCGTGSVAQLDGKVRLDAGIMDGSNLKCGAVGAIENIQNPISVARNVMEKTNHCLIVSKYATQFAVENGFKKIRIKSMHSKKSRHDTVGAVAVDKEGRIAAGASTGGITRMLPGRVGDSAIVGAGYYANGFAGAVSTGTGEAFMRTTAIKKVIDYAQEGKSLRNVLKVTLNTLKQITGFEGGIIILDKKGNYAAYHTAAAMPWVYRKG